METRLIHTRFWSDDYIMSLPLKGKMFFNYLITNERVNVLGVYELPDAYIKMHLGLNQRDIEHYKQQFQEDGKFFFFKSWVRILKFERYQKYTGELNERAKEKLLLLVPPEIFDTPSKGYTRSIDTSINKKSEIRNKKSEGESEGEYSQAFSAFWYEYPRKVGKGAAWKAWGNIKNRDEGMILRALKTQRVQEQWLKDKGQYIPHPATWLNQRRWEDDVGEAVTNDLSQLAKQFQTT